VPVPVTGDSPTAWAAAAVDRAVAAALWTALRTFGRIPGGRVIDAPDATLIMSGTGYPSFNNVVASDLTATDIGARIDEVLRQFLPASVPVTWWVGPTTRPTDLAARLERLGMIQQEPEFAMALDLAEGWHTTPAKAGATVEVVERADQLDEWLTMMHAAYGWPDAQKSAIVRSMYRDGLSRPAELRDTHHFLVRMEGRPAACSSLFVGEGAAFVTNIGTAPDARGHGLGTLATVATLTLAREMGRALATLTASLDGRGVYGRLGFREAGVLDRYVAGDAVLARLAPGAASSDSS